MGEMTAEERDELQDALEAAGCRYVAANLDWLFMTGGYELLAELRSLLRREERLRVMEAGVRAADRLLDASTDSPYGTYRMYGQGPLAIKLMNADRGRVDEARKLLETEVPDGQG